MERFTNAREGGPCDYPFRRELQQLRSFAGMFLSNLEEMETVPLGPHHGALLQHVRIGMEQVAQAVNRIVGCLAGGSSPEIDAGLVVWATPLNADLNELLEVVRQVQNKVDHFVALLDEDESIKARCA